jgi:hypothetical protein
VKTYHVAIDEPGGRRFLTVQAHSTVNAEAQVAHWYHAAGKDNVLSAALVTTFAECLNGCDADPRPTGNFGPSPLEDLCDLLGTITCPSDEEHTSETLQTIQRLAVKYRVSADSCGRCA